MVLRAVRRRPILDGLDVFRRLDSATSSRVLSDPARLDAVMDKLRDGLHETLKTPSTVQGWRAQALFASMVAALDGCVMLTQVDVGEIYVDGPSVKAPDFFLHLRSGKRILVDVKNVAAPDSADSLVKFSASEISRLRRFGELYGMEVYLALYYRAFPMWALVSIDDLSPGPGGGLRITFSTAMKRSNTAMLGDYSVGVTPPLELTLRADPSSPNHIAEDGRAKFKIGEVEVRAGGRRVTTKEAQQIVMFLMMNGQWNQTEHPNVQDSRVMSLTCRAKPEAVSNPGEDFEIIGSLTSMYARQFESGTTSPAGMTGLDLPTQPGVLVSLIPHDYNSDDLHLWRFTIRPSERGPQPDVT